MWTSARKLRGEVDEYAVADRQRTDRRDEDGQVVVVVGVAGDVVVVVCAGHGGVGVLVGDEE